MGVPVSCCLSAAGIGFMVILCPLGSWAFLTVGLPVLEPRDRTPTGLPRCAPMRCGRDGCPLYPGGGGVHTAGSSPGRRLPHLNGQPLPPWTATRPRTHH